MAEQLSTNTKAAEQKENKITTSSAIDTKRVVIVAFALLALFILVLLAVFKFQDEFQSPIVIIFTAGLIAGILSSLLPSSSAKELKPVIEQQQKAEEKYDKVPNIRNSISVQQKELKRYYEENQSQARNSFRFSMGAIVAGLTVIIIGIITFYFKKNPSIQLAAISAVAGILSQFIGGAYFFLYKKSLDQFDHFFHQLIKMQDTMLAIDLICEIENSTKQTELRERIIVALLERSSSVSSITLHPQTASNEHVPVSNGKQ